MVPPKYIDASAPLKLQYALNRNTGQIHFICTVHGYNSSSKINIVSIKEWMVATTFVKYRNNVLWKNFSLRLITLNYEEKMFFRSNYFVSRSFFMSCHYTKTFVHLLIIAAVSDFNAFKLTG